MNFSRISDRTHLGRLLRLPLRLIPSGTRMPIMQGKLSGKRWIIGASGRTNTYVDHAYWMGTYEYEMQRLFEKTILRGSNVFDIGAHAGFYTLLASVLVGATGAVFAFEPLPRNIFYLGEHLEVNRVTNVKVIEAAVSDRNGSALFEEGYTSFVGRVSPHGNLRVRVVSLDEMISEGEVPIPDCIKIDVEGAEMQVLLGAKEILKNSHPKIFISLHGHDMHKQCCQFLRSLNYQLGPVGQETVEQSDTVLATVGNTG